MNSKRFTLLSLLFLGIFLLSACNNVEKVQHIEVFAIEILESNDEGILEKTGYKKVNAITSTEQSENHIKTDAKNIEDFYDAEGNYIKTVIFHSVFEKSNITQVEDGEDRKTEINKPSTILIPDGKMEPFELDDMTKEEEEKVKEHVLSFMEML